MSSHVTFEAGRSVVRLSIAAEYPLTPAINIIIVTGYGAPDDVEIPPGSLFVPKPYSARKMLEAVRHFQ
jgi:hypothetical protein